MRRMIGDTPPHLLQSDLAIAKSFVSLSTPGENGSNTSSTRQIVTTLSLPVTAVSTVATSLLESMTPLLTSSESVTSTEVTTLTEQTSHQLETSSNTNI